MHMHVQKIRMVMREVNGQRARGRGAERNNILIAVHVCMTRRRVSLKKLQLHSRSITIMPFSVVQFFSRLVSSWVVHRGYEDGYDLKHRREGEPHRENDAVERMGAIHMMWLLTFTFGFCDGLRWRKWSSMDFCLFYILSLIHVPSAQ